MLVQPRDLEKARPPLTDSTLFPAPRLRWPPIDECADITGVQETDAMMVTLAPTTEGHGALGNDEMLRAALNAAGCPELQEEISPSGRGAGIYHAIADQGSVPVRDLAAWVCVEKKCSRVRVRRVGLRESSAVHFSCLVQPLIRGLVSAMLNSGGG